MKNYVGKTNYGKKGTNLRKSCIQLYIFMTKEISQIVDSIPFLSASQYLQVSQAISTIKQVFYDQPVSYNETEIDSKKKELRFCCSPHIFSSTKKR